eukprot:TRINITY_DN16799_c0_g1_i1.p1 TRINITY_DN16799_c0_g1~~TRINITY_DN16799_c0_g1_i1.p1  ORF type:complete len:585 (-),score=55.80 TRINITY_DN16799_c0_g1_i1:62-1726(-)
METVRFDFWAQRHCRQLWAVVLVVVFNIIVADVFESGDGEGNKLCWDYENFKYEDLSYSKCCTSQDGVDTCFRRLGGWYNFNFCCFRAVVDSCDWDGDFLETAAIHVGIDRLDFQRYPMVLREACCVMPGTPETGHHCWNVGAGLVDPTWIRCCLPDLRRKLHSADPQFMAKEIAREFAPSVGRRWSPSEFDDFEVTSRRVGKNRPCRFRVRHGNEVSLCDLRTACPICNVTQDARCAHNDCSYLKAVQAGLTIVATLRPLPDMDFFVSPGNTDSENFSVPVFTRHRPREPRSHYVLLPMEWQLHPSQMRKHTTGVEREGASIPWEKRYPQLIWRGTNSNAFDTCSIVKATVGNVSWASCLEGEEHDPVWNWTNWLGMPRGRLVLMTQFAEHLIDARFTGLSQRMDDSLWTYLNEHNLTASYMSSFDQAMYRYTLNIDGTGNGDRIYWQMFAGSLVLVQDSPLVSWLVGNVQESNSALVPFEHYVPVRYDLSDLISRLEWLRSNDAEANRIAIQAARFATRHLGYEGVLFYLHRMVEHYAEHHIVQPWPVLTEL